MVPHARVLVLLPEVLLGAVAQQGDEDAEAGEDVDDREDLGPRVVGAKSPKPTVVSATTEK